MDKTAAELEQFEAVEEQVAVSKAAGVEVVAHQIELALVAVDLEAARGAARLDAGVHPDELRAIRRRLEGRLLGLEDYLGVRALARDEGHAGHVEHRGLGGFIDSNERIANRVSFAIVVAALIVGSSLIVHSQIPPKWFDIPLIGLAGYLVAGVMGLLLLVSILRHGRM